MKIVQLTTSPIAFYPYRLSECINRYSDYSSRCVELRSGGHFDHDLAFDKDKELCIELLNKADVIHMHNYLTLDSTDFAPVNLRKLHDGGTKFVIHYHSAPEIIKKVRSTMSMESIINPEIPSIVSAQMQSKFYPNSYLVPHILPLHNEEYRNKGYMYDVSFFASNKLDIRNRFDSKGWSNVCGMLDVSNAKNVYKSAECKLGFKEMLDIKSRSLIVIDDLFSGTWHLTSLEALAMSKVAMCYMDNYTEAVFKYITDSVWLPFINVHFNDSLELINWFVENRSAAIEHGKKGRDWLEKYYGPDVLVKKWFVPMYNYLFEDTAKLRRQKELRDIPFNYNEINELMHDMKIKNVRCW